MTPPPHTHTFEICEMVLQVHLELPAWLQEQMNKYMAEIGWFNSNSVQFLNFLALCLSVHFTHQYLIFNSIFSILFYTPLKTGSCYW